MYLVLAIGTVVGVLVHRHRVLAGIPGVSANSLAAQEIAYLQGGPELAIYSALAALRCAGAVGTSPAPDRFLVPTEALPAGASPLERAVYAAAGTSRRTGQLAADAGVAAELARLRERLEQMGLLPGVAAFGALRTGRRVLLAVLLLGVARLFAGIANDRPVGYLVVALVALAVVIVLLYRRRPRRTQAADHVLTVLRGGNTHLAPAQHPAWTLYGATGAATAVALFGTPALWAADPAFAAEADVRRRFAAAYVGAGSSGGATSGSTSGGYSCGAGSGSSSCGSSGSDSGGGGGGGGCGG
ncbi:TIGR04222 domain-containing membrane protein [Phytohabitans rumicis]|uniref:TIGR04222 domain-containing membrane protein n=2 Tax=Phytohabitans rumicis TaxID=1076125 RepID=A0A6V8LGG2_9ACTN|nr:TIGR04222 domain-containing membrane protein [Phytohabitans rumicis]GFJ96352.1 hypothetical protein Prum_099940 [Phytohabitans rumicis]